MFAVIQVGASQFKVSEGDTIQADRIEHEVGKSFDVDGVLLFSSGEDLRVGQPVLKDVKVTAKVVAHVLADRTLAFKYRKRKNSASRRGSRHQLTSLNITKISAV